MVAALLLSVAIMAQAEPVTYVFSGILSEPVGAFDCKANNSVNGTITMDFANAIPAQSKGSVGSPSGWTSVSATESVLVSTPSVFTMAVCGYGPYLSVHTSSITVGPGGISGQFVVDSYSVSGNFSFSNPSGAVSAAGMPLFDSPGTGSGVLGGGSFGIPFIVTSMTLISPTVTKQLDSVVNKSFDAPSLIIIANTAQAQVQSACMSLEAYVLRVKAKLVLKELPRQRADQLVFDAMNVAAAIGCN
jgi:hypothetical protein